MEVLAHMGSNRAQKFDRLREPVDGHLERVRLLALAEGRVEAWVRRRCVHAQRQHMRPTQLCLDAIGVLHKVLKLHSPVSLIKLVGRKRTTVILATLELIADVVGKRLLACCAVQNVAEVGFVGLGAVRLELLNDGLLVELQKGRQLLGIVP
eukprot:scaffold193986_cov28-Tisochrysis_lutea.AAC.1